MAEPPPSKKLKFDKEDRSPHSLCHSTRSGSSSTIKEESTQLGDDESPPSPFTGSNFDESHFLNVNFANYDLQLYYDSPAPSRQNGLQRALRILLTPNRPLNDAFPSAGLSSGWNAHESAVNLFLEAGFQLPGLERQCHLQFESAPESIKAGDIRRQLALYLDVETSNLQLEFQLMMSKADTTMINPRTGSCRRALAVWNDTSLNDRSTLKEILSKARLFEQEVGVPQPGDQYLWFRVSRVEILSLKMIDKSIDTVITPDQTATVGDLRKFVAKLRSSVPDAIHLHVDDREMEEDDWPLQVFSLPPGSEIACWLEQVDCAICGDDEIPYSDFQLPITPGCLHKRQTCSDCVQRWIATKLDNGDWNAIGCPGDECKETLQYAEMRKFASEEHFERSVNTSPQLQARLTV
jgi:hypothetical protein